MANETVADIEPLEFHSCNTPRGMLYYNMGDLTHVQQAKLIELKIKTVKEDEQYLADHPEIRACIGLVTRHVMNLRPRDKVHEVVAQFFARSRIDIEEEVKQYVKEMEPNVREGDSAVGLFARPSSNNSSFDDMSTFSRSTDQLGSECSGSLKNIDVKMSDLPTYGSNTLVNSISQITHQSHQADQEKLKKSLLETMVEDLIIHEVLDKMPYPPEEDKHQHQHDDDSNGLSPKVSFCLKVDVLTTDDETLDASVPESVELAPVEDDVVATPPVVEPPVPDRGSTSSLKSDDQPDQAFHKTSEVTIETDITMDTVATGDTNYSAAGVSYYSDNRHQVEEHQESGTFQQSEKLQQSEGLQQSEEHHQGEGLVKSEEHQTKEPQLNEEPHQNEGVQPSEGLQQSTDLQQGEALPQSEGLQQNEGLRQSEGQQESEGIPKSEGQPSDAV